MDHLYDIALSMIPQLGSKSIRKLYELVPSAQQLYSLPLRDLNALFGNRHKAIVTAIAERTTMQRAENELRFMERKGIQALLYTDKEYPQRLNRPDCDDTPPLLYYKGEANLNSTHVISVVGTRRATEYGKETTRALLQGFAASPVLVTSGLALGIDAAAHRSALEFGLPTVGVVAHGFDHFYPPQNKSLAQRMIAAKGGMLTEYPTSTPINPGMFPARNRIIAALCDVVVVVEASTKGGALITANLANGYHREVAAFPGRVGDPYSEGCNRIIASQKAQLIQSHSDLRYLMSWDLTPRANQSHNSFQQELLPVLTRDETAVFNILAQQGPLPIEGIMGNTTLSMPQIASILLSLELKNVCRCLPGKIYKVCCK